MIRNILMLKKINLWTEINFPRITVSKIWENLDYLETIIGNCLDSSMGISAN